MGVAFPSHILNSKDFAPALSEVFSDNAKVYDLAALERLQPGFGQRVWELVQISQETENIKRKSRQRSLFERIFG